MDAAFSSQEEKKTTIEHLRYGRVVIKLRMLVSICFVVLCACGISSCSEESRMLSELSEYVPGFNAETRYAAYLKQHGKKAQKLRQAAEQATKVRIHIIRYRYPKNLEENLPLSANETQAVREILANVQETPAFDFNLWLAEEYDSHFVQAAPPLYTIGLVLDSPDGELFLPVAGGISTEMGDLSKAEEYRTMRPRPTFMLPSASVARWNEMTFITRAKKRADELLQQILAD